MDVPRVELVVLDAQEERARGSAEDVVGDHRAVGDRDVPDQLQDAVPLLPGADVQHVRLEHRVVDPDVLLVAAGGGGARTIGGFAPPRRRRATLPIRGGRRGRSLPGASPVAVRRGRRNAASVLVVVVVRSRRLPGGPLEDAGFFLLPAALPGQPEGLPLVVAPDLRLEGFRDAAETVRLVDGREGLREGRRDDDRAVRREEPFVDYDVVAAATKAPGGGGGRARRGLPGPARAVADGGSLLPRDGGSAHGRRRRRAARRFPLFRVRVGDDLRRHDAG
mmetsp:Transcript_7302/g.17805  ORF Transcript_7302/g.17805 Transcript_7302/m.17805 type:complete len:278 (-) Transcript_7302:36-869(-)